MSRPAIRRATELPIVSMNDWDNVQLVKAAIRAHELGSFHQSAAVVDGMGRDDRISGCLETRTSALPALPLTLEPRGDGRMRRAVAKELDELFEVFYPNAALTELLQWGVLLGFGLGENVWEYGERRWNLRLKVWHPRYVYYRHDTRTFWLQTGEGPREITPGDGQWVVFAPYGLERGWMRGKVRSLYVPWLMRSWGLRDWARYSEVHGHPIKKAVMPPNTEKQDQENFLAEIAQIGAETTLATPRTGQEEHERYDLELLEAMNNNWQTFDKLLDKAEACIAVNLLGQNLTTEVKGGSYAAADAHMRVKAEVMQFDAESLGQCLREQSLAWWTLHNHGSAELAPMPKWKTKAKTVEERNARGTALKNLGEGISTARAAGIQVDVDKITEEEDIPTTGPAEDVEPQPAATGGDADPSADEGDVAGGRPRNGERQGKLPSARRPQAQASKRKRKLLAAADDEVVPPVPAAAVEGQSYVDRLADDGTKQLAKELAKDLDAILELVKDAPDFATLRKRLLDLYGEMDADDEAELLHQGLLMAELAGRYAARKEAGLSVEPEEDDE